MLTPFQTSSLLVQSLHDEGVRHAIISPGSRSTPVTLAFAYHDGFNKKIVLDERTAAFIALGIGKETGLPAVLICTSGTAAANYFPAIVEAKNSGVPIIVLTADRPPNLRGIGSSQTIDQIKLYGDYSVYFHEMGEPADGKRDRNRIRFSAKQSTAESIKKGGAAHLNIPFRKPLEPSAEQIDLERKKNKKQVENHITSKPSSTRSVTLSDEVTNLINRSARPLMIAGPANKHHTNHTIAQQLAELTGSPVIAEPGSRFHLHEQRIHRFQQFLRVDSVRRALKPDLILRFGDQPFTKSLLTVLEKWEKIPCIRFNARDSWQDSEMSSDHIVELSQDDTLSTDNIEAGNHSFLNKWRKADTDAEEKLFALMESEASLTDGHIFKHISNTLKDEWNLMVSNSFPPRDLALFGEPGGNVVVNRGAAGIDGIISTAIGTALSSDAPTCCVVGDLAFLHDSNAMMSLKYLDSPFKIIVINNNGGNIFRMLPIYEHSDTYREYFETPQDVDIEYIAKAHNCQYKRIRDKSNLNQISFTENNNPNPLVIECVTNTDASMAMRKKLFTG